MTGRSCGMLTVLERDAEPSRRVKWLCLCKCGKVKAVDGFHLRSGAIRSCGSCAKSATGSVWNIRHGDTKGGRTSPEWRSWNCMIQRCTLKSHDSYPNYGGRGVVVCERWMSFVSFLADMGRKPSRKHTIDRMDTNGNYEPGNCRWATPAEQARNRRNSIYVEHNGESLTTGEWSARLGASANLVRERLLRGWSSADAVSIPVGQRRSSR